jgi:hypothetical protein
MARWLTLMAMWWTGIVPSLVSRLSRWQDGHRPWDTGSPWPARAAVTTRAGSVGQDSMVVVPMMVAERKIGPNFVSPP